MTNRIPITYHDLSLIPTGVLIIGGVLAYEKGQLVFVLIEEYRDEILRLLNENCPELVSRILS